MTLMMLGDSEFRMCKFGANSLKVLEVRDGWAAIHRDGWTQGDWDEGWSMEDGTLHAVIVSIDSLLDQRFQLDISPFLPHALQYHP